MCARSLVFEQLVIKPTLAYLGIVSAATCRQLADSLLDRPEVESNTGYPGLYAIDSAQHRALWDQHLAFNPELASKVRSLASRENFLRDPDQELRDNPAYATAIACLLQQFNLGATPSLAPAHLRQSLPEHSTWPRAVAAG